ncbi:MAG: ParB N-terminal domain-containing protein [Candidatus Vogelbacteria bacterium]|nr:ParB N-terminal domain-containing protein [Candidatus Vogelbacteria bacterium]
MKKSNQERFGRLPNPRKKRKGEKVTERRMTLSVSDLKVVLFVRKELDQDRVLQFALRYEAGEGEKLGPLLVNEDYEIIDGRHRFAALPLASILTVECIVRCFASKEEELITAFVANMGGAMPPTTEDFHFVINQLMDQRLTRRQTQNRFESYVPKTIMRRYCDEVQSKRNHSAMAKARAVVSNGEMKVDEAAVKFAVDPKALKDLIAGVRNRQKTVGRELGVIKVELAKRHKALSVYMQKMFADLFKKYEDGDIDWKFAETVFGQIDRARKRSGEMINEIRARFEAIRKREETSKS